MSAINVFGTHLIGFVLRKEDRAVALGSGTLVRRGKIYGILTAAHVVEEIKTFPEIGLLQFVVRENKYQLTTIQKEHLDSIEFRKAPWSVQGPDLAFIRLPPHIGSAIGAASSYFNFNLHKKKALGTKPKNTRIVDCVLGLVWEWKNEPQIKKFRRGTKMLLKSTTQIEGLQNIGTANGMTHGREGFDRMLFKPEPASHFDLPASYKATSGGGLIRFYINRDTNRISQARLIGVAYYETDKKRNGQRNLICHGPKSLYEKLDAAMIEKWGADCHD